MKNVRGTVIIEVENCKGCELCIEACAQKSLALSPKINGLGYRYIVLVQDNCTGCVNCALVCPESVITVYRAAKKTPASGVPQSGNSRSGAKKAPASGVPRSGMEAIAAPTGIGRVDL